MGNAQTHNGLNIYQAAQNGDLSVVQILLHEYKVDPNEKHQKDDSPRSEQTALHIAVRLNRIDVARSLLDYGALPDIRNGSSQTALHLALAAGNFKMCELLIRCGADVRAVDLHGKSCFSEIVKTGNAALLSHLVHFKSQMHFAKAFCKEAQQQTGVSGAVGLDQVWLLPLPAFRRAGRFPRSFAEARPRLVRASAAMLGARAGGGGGTGGGRVLFIAHRWLGPAVAAAADGEGGAAAAAALPDPDPRGIHYSLVAKFLEEKGFLGFEYVWLDVACLPGFPQPAAALLRPPREGAVRLEAPWGDLGLLNVVAAAALSSDVLLLPALRAEPPDCIVSDLDEALGRAWLRLEAAVAMLAGASLHVAFYLWQEDFTDQPDGDVYFHWAHGDRQEGLEEMAQKAAAYFEAGRGYAPALLRALTQPSGSWAAGAARLRAPLDALLRDVLRMLDEGGIQAGDGRMHTNSIGSLHNSTTRVSLNADTEPHLEKLTPTEVWSQRAFLGAAAEAAAAAAGGGLGGVGAPYYDPDDVDPLLVSSFDEVLGFERNPARRALDQVGEASLGYTDKLAVLRLYLTVAQFCVKRANERYNSGCVVC